jgi:hypothetical protein
MTRMQLEKNVILTHVASRKNLNYDLNYHVLQWAGTFFSATTYTLPFFSKNNNEVHEKETNFFLLNTTLYKGMVMNRSKTAHDKSNIPGAARGQ